MNAIIFKELVITLGKWFSIGILLSFLVAFIGYLILDRSKQDTIQQQPTRAIRQASFDGKTWYTIDTITLKP